MKLPSTYRSPTYNGMTIVILVGWLLLNVGFVVFLSSGTATEANSPKIQTESNIGAHRIWLVGVVLGLVASFSWLATSLSNPFTRFLARLLAALPFVLVLTFLGTLDRLPDAIDLTDLLPSAINILGLILIQPFVFLIAGIPSWSFSGRSQIETSDLQLRNQYHIGDLIVLTAVVAMLLTTGGRLTTPINSLAYWPVLVLCWFLLPTLAALTIQAVMYRRPLAGLLMMMLICLAAIGLATAESLFRSNAVSIGVFIRGYTLLLGGYAMSIVITSLSGTPEPSPTKTNRLSTDIAAEPDKKG